MKKNFFLKYLFIPNCMRIIMWLLVNNTLENMLFKSSTNCFFSQAPMCLVFQYLLTLLIAVYINLWKCSCDLSKCLENVKLPTAVFCEKASGGLWPPLKYVMSVFILSSEIFVVICTKVFQICMFIFHTCHGVTWQLHSNQNNEQFIITVYTNTLPTPAHWWQI